MSNKLFGNEHKIEKMDGNVSVFNDMAETGWIDPNPAVTPSRGNRKTEFSKIEKYLRSGFNWNLWKNPSVAVLPNGEMVLFDGDHRRHMYMLTFPGEKMPVDLYNVQNHQEIADLFVSINKKNRTELTPEEIFVNEVHALDSSALEEANLIREAGLKVDLNTEEVCTVVGEKGDPSIRVQGFRSCIKRASAEHTVLASKKLQQIYPDDSELKTELLGALALVYCKTELVSNKKFRSAAVEKFEGWLKNMPLLVSTQRDMIDLFKRDGHDLCAGVVHSEKSMHAIALGMMHRAKRTLKFDSKTWHRYYSEGFEQIKNEIEKNN